MTASRSQPAIVATALTKRFGDDHSPSTLSTWSSPPGRIYGLLGPNGSGKTTLIRLLTGLAEPTSGEARVLGVQMPDREILGRVGYMTQADGIYVELSVWENVRFFGALIGQADKESLEDALKVVELYERREHAGARAVGWHAPPSVAGLRAGPSAARCIFLDEPTVGIDPQLRVQFWEYFRRLAADGKTLVVSSHVMDEADRCDELLLMLHGKLLGARQRRRDPPAGRRRRHRAGVPAAGRQHAERARPRRERATHLRDRPTHRGVLPTRPPHARARLRRADRDHGAARLGHP